MTLKVLDLSNNNDVVDMAQVARAGVAGVITKCVEATTYRDPTYRPNWDALGTLKLFRGAYAFARPEYSSSPEAQADFFLSNLEAAQPGDALALDLETPLDGSAGDLSDWALTWLERVERQVGFAPMLYSFSDFILHHLTAPRLGTYNLWLASWGSWLPPSIGPWKEIALWQHSASSTVAGVSGPVDESLIARDFDGLRALGKPSPVPLPPPPSFATGPVYRATTAHFLRILPKVSAPHSEATVVEVGELLDANAASPSGVPSWTSAWRHVKRRKTGQLGFAYAPDLSLP